MPIHKLVRLACAIGAPWCALHAGNTALAVIPDELSAETDTLEWLVQGPFDSAYDADAGPAGPVSAIASAAFPGGASSTSSNASADYGYLDVYTQSVGFYDVPDDTLFSSQGRSRATFRDDTVVVNAPGYGPGQFGSFVAQFDVNHDVNFMINSVQDNGGLLELLGGFHLEVIIGNATPGPFGGMPWTYSSNSGSSSPVVPSGPMLVNVMFEYGVPFTIAADLEVELFSSITGDLEADYDATMNLGSAFSWKGIDTTGLPNGTTISSENVEDWSVAYGEIPAPSAMAVLAIGGLAAQRRRRR